MNFQFKLEENQNTQQTPSSPTNGTNNDPLKISSISSVPRKQNSSENVHADIASSVAEDDQDNESKSGLSSQALVQRRRRPKRRSTGLVHVDMEVNWISR
jgi:hypothetical protein